MNLVCSRKAGFTMVEVSLAILVFAIGMLALFGVFPSALSAGRRAADESRMSIFAEDVFNTLHARAANDWSTIFDPIPAVPAPPVGDEIWADESGVLEILPNEAGPRVNVYRYQGASGEVYEYALRYTLTVIQKPTRPRVAAARLDLWPGETGPTDIVVGGGGYIFYTELYHYED